MDNIENFYLKIQADLKTLQTNRLVKERLLPIKIYVHDKRKETSKIKIITRKEQKQRKNIEKGYHKGVSDSIRIVNKIFKEYLDCLIKD